MIRSCCLVHDRPRPPRRSLVQLTSEENASSLLAVAKQLRTSSNQLVAASVYINRDLSIEEAKTAHEKSQRRRARKHDVENNQHDHQSSLCQASTDLQTAASVTDTIANTAAQVTSLTDPLDAATPSSSSIIPPIQSCLPCHPPIKHSLQPADQLKQTTQALRQQWIHHHV